MADLNMVLGRMQRLNSQIADILKVSTYNDYDDLSGLDIDYQDSGQIFLLDTLRKIAEKLDDVMGQIEYISRPVREVSRLHRNESGRYETEDGHYYTCGSEIEALVTDDYHEAPYWTWTSVEHDGTDYFLAGYKNIRMDGLTVRVREMK